MFNSTLQTIAKVITPRSSVVLPTLTARFFAAQPSKKVLVDDRFIVLQSSETTSIDESAKEFKYPKIWLRDNCQCNECFHASSKSRIMSWESFDFDRAVPKSVSADESLKIVWNDNHESKYDYEWLHARNFTPENRTKYLQTVYRLQPRLWSKKDFKVKHFEYKNIMETNEGLLAWLESLARDGCAFVDHTPLDENVNTLVANRVGFIKKTHYGEQFGIRAKENTNNTAYLSKNLQLHTDLPFYEYQPGVNLLHCIVQSESDGAVNLITDGFYVAERLKNEHPKCYECLTTVPVNWSDYGEEDGNKFYKVYCAPVICSDREGIVDRINYSVPQRDSQFSIDVEKVDEWYRSMMTFWRLSYEEALTFKMKPGVMFTFCNTRLLHGRTSYTDSSNNTRYIIGTYIDWDEIYSRIRVLKFNDTV